MSESNTLNKQVQEIADAESALKEAANSKPSESVPVKVNIDPLVLFQQIESLRKDGVSEDVIKAAFVEFMAEARGEYRKPQLVSRKTKDSVPMPTQEEINKRYEGLAKEKEETMTPEVKLIIEELQRSKDTREKLSKIPLKTRIAYYILRKVIGAMIYVFKKLGVG